MPFETRSGRGRYRTLEHSVTGTRTRNSFAFLIVLLSMLLSPSARAEEMVPVRPDASFTLRTGIAHGKMVYIGKGGAIDGQVNPTLVVHQGGEARLTAISA